MNDKRAKTEAILAALVTLNILPHGGRITNDDEIIFFDISQKHMFEFDSIVEAKIRERLIHSDDGIGLIFRLKEFRHENLTLQFLGDYVIRNEFIYFITVRVNDYSESCWNHCRKDLEAIGKTLTYLVHEENEKQLRSVANEMLTKVKKVKKI